MVESYRETPTGGNVTQVKIWLRRLFCLSPLITVLIAAPSFASLVVVLAKNLGGPIAYAVYFTSSYGLTVTVTGLVRLAKAVREKVVRVPLVSRLVRDSSLRMRLALRIGFVVNLLYVVLKLSAGIYYRSEWFLALAVYYTLLMGMRFSLFRCKNEAEILSLKQELRRYRLCGLMMFPMDLALVSIVFLMAHHQRGFDYPGFLIYAMAAYAFYAVISAAISLVRLRKHQNVLISAAKAVKLTTAMVSVLALETAMLDRFGGSESLSFRVSAIEATGGGICSIVFCMAVFMTAHGSRELKKYNETKS